MQDGLHPIDFVDYDAIFSDALSLLGKGMSVPEAIEASLKERYSLTYKEIGLETRAILDRLRRERDWGPVRALRELANNPGLADSIRSQRQGSSTPPRARERTPEAPIADYGRIFALAQRRRQSGFSLEDSLDMAARELYPQTFRKVKEQSLAYIRRLADKQGMHELRALRELAEDASLLTRIEDGL
jgi:hypothetical protein